MRIFKYLLLLMLLFSLVACSKDDKPARSVFPTVNNPVPDITVYALADGSPLKLHDLKGKVVLLNFWATWCPPCREEIPSMMKLNSAMAGRDFRMVAVSLDDGGKEAVESYFRKTGFSLPTYLDQGGIAKLAFGITGVPESYLIDKNGILIKKIIGGATWDAPEVFALLEKLMK